MPKKRIVDITHVKSAGGGTIFQLYMQNVSLTGEDFLLGPAGAYETNAKCIEISSEVARCAWYLRNQHLVASHDVISLNSTLCICATRFTSAIFFHNVLLLKNQYKLIYQRLSYFLSRKHKVYAQTEAARRVINTISKNKCLLLPFYPIISPPLEIQKVSKRIFHISSQNDHKQNHFVETLLDNSTISNDYEIYSTVEFPEYPAVNHIKNLPHKELISLMASGEILLNTSRSESLCLPLVEAAQLGLTIVSFDSAYVREVVDNIYTFTTEEELLATFLNAFKCKRPRISIANKLTDLKSKL